MQHILTSAAIAAFACSAFGGTATVTLTGTVDLDLNFGGGPFSSLVVGDVVTVTYDVTYPGTVITPGSQTDYVVDTGSFVLAVNGNPNAAGLSGAPSLSVENDNPDDVFGFGSALTNGAFMGTAFTMPSSFYATTDISALGGTYALTGLTSADDFRLTDSGGFTGIAPNSVAITIPPSTGYTIIVTGTVLSNSYSSGMFAGASVNDVAVLSYEVDPAGTVIAPGQLVNYAIDLSTFDLDINGSTGAALGSATDVAIQNDFPAADGVRIFQTQLATGHFFTCEMGADGSFLPSVDIAALPGSYDFLAHITSFGYVIQGQGGMMEILPEFLDIIGPTTGTPYCFCDGSGAAAPCGNNGGAGNGCANGGFAAGASLSGDGNASASASTVVLSASGVPVNQPGLFFQGTVDNNGGLGVIFGDGLRCAGGTVIRLEVDTADAGGNSETSIDIATKGGVSGGQTFFYQLWYRDPLGSPCGSQFNTTNGLEITWGS